MSERRCSSCAWFANLSAAKAFGECRRYPPKVVTFEDEDGENLVIKGDIFPRTSASSWCGEHRGRD